LQSSANKDLLKKEIFVFGEFEGVPLNVRVYPFAVLCKKLFFTTNFDFGIGVLKGFTFCSFVQKAFFTTNFDFGIGVLKGFTP
jgi:hypothetical protein